MTLLEQLAGLCLLTLILLDIFTTVLFNGLADFLGYSREQIDVSTWIPAHGKD